MKMNLVQELKEMQRESAYTYKKFKKGCSNSFTGPESMT